MVRGARFLGLIISLILIPCSCTGPVGLRPLPRSEPLNVDSIVLSDQLEPADIRSLFRAVNRDHRLDKLRRYFEIPSDPELKFLTDLLNRIFMYERRLTDLVSKRLEVRGFSQWNDDFKKMAKSPDFPAFRRELQKICGREDFYQFLNRDANFIGPEWVSIWNALQSARESFRERFVLPPESPKTELKVEDLRRLLADRSLRPHWNDLVGALESDGLGHIVWNGFRGLDEKYGAKGMFGVHLSLKNLIRRAAPADDFFTEQTSWERLVHLAGLLNSPTEGLFDSIARKLDPRKEIAKPILDLLHGFVMRSLSKQVARRLEASGWNAARFLALAQEKNERDGNILNSLYSEILNSFVGPPLKKESERQYLEVNLPLQFNAYVLAVWFREMVRVPNNLKRLREIKGNAYVWDMDLEFPDFSFGFVKLEKGKLTFPVKERLTDPKLKALHQSFVEESTRRFLKNPHFGHELRYSVLAAPEKRSLRNSLSVALTACDDVQPVINTEGAMQWLLQELSSPQTSLPLFLGNLESGKEPFLRGVNRHLLGMPLGDFRRFFRFLFEEIEIGKLDPGIRQIFLDLFTESGEVAHRDRLGAIFDNLQALWEADRLPGPRHDSRHDPRHDPRHEMSLPSVAEAYLSLISFSNEHQLDWVSKGVRLLSRANLLGWKKAEPSYPSLFRAAETGELAGWFYAYSQLSKSQSGELIEGVDRAFGGALETTGQSGFDKHADLFLNLIEGNASDLISAINFLRDEINWFFSPRSLSLAERDWLLQFVRSKEAENFLQWWKKYSAPGETASVVQLLRRLAQQGDISEALKLLRFVKQDRVRELANLGLWLIETGEWDKMFESLELFTK